MVITAAQLTGEQRRNPWEISSIRWNKPTSPAIRTSHSADRRGTYVRTRRSERSPDQYVPLRELPSFLARFTHDFPHDFPQSLTQSPSRAGKRREAHASHTEAEVDGCGCGCGYGNTRVTLGVARYVQHVQGNTFEVTR